MPAAIPPESGRVTCTSLMFGGAGFLRLAGWIAGCNPKSAFVAGCGLQSDLQLAAKSDGVSHPRSPWLLFNSLREQSGSSTTPRSRGKEQMTGIGCSVPESHQGRKLTVSLRRKLLLGYGATLLVSVLLVIWAIMSLNELGQASSARCWRQEWDREPGGLDTHAAWVAQVYPSLTRFVRMSVRRLGSPGGPLPSCRPARVERPHRAAAPMSLGEPRSAAARAARTGDGVGMSPSSAPDRREEP